MFSCFNHFKKIKSGGFTLVELLVAVSVFTVALVLFSQVYVNALKTERIGLAYINNITSAEYALDYTTRDIRMGTQFKKSGNNLVFVSRKGENITYSLKNNQVYRNTYPITPPDLKVNSLQFDLSGGSIPLISIQVALEDQTQQVVSLRTKVSPRMIYTILSK